MVSATATAVTGAGQVVAAGPATYRGYSLSATTAAVVRIFDNPSAPAGILLDTIALAANTSAQAWYGDGGLRAVQGVYVQVVSGTVEGSVRIG